MCLRPREETRSTARAQTGSLMGKPGERMTFESARQNRGDLSQEAANLQKLTTHRTYRAVCKNAPPGEEVRLRPGSPGGFQPKAERGGVSEHRPTVFIPLNMSPKYPCCLRPFTHLRREWHTNAHAYILSASFARSTHRGLSLMSKPPRAPRAHTHTCAHNTHRPAHACTHTGTPLCPPDPALTEDSLSRTRKSPCTPRALSAHSAWWRVTFP